MSLFQTHYDAVVVGGGHNGLVAAAYLSRAGHSVLVLEREPRLGGATTSRAVFPGMDARLSRYAYLVSLLPESIVQDLGLQFACRKREIASCTPYHRAGEDRALLLSNVDATRSLDALLQLSNAQDVRGYRRLQELEHALAQRVWPSLLEPLSSRARWVESLASSDERQAWEEFVERPLGESIESHVQDDVLRGIVFTDGKIGVFTHAHDSSLLQNRCFILHVVGGATGDWKVPLGGMGALVDALAAAASGAGAQLMTNALATSVLTGSRRHTVAFRHKNSEHEVEATRVLVSAGPQVLAGLLGATYEAQSSDEGSVCKVNMLLRRLPRLRARGVDPLEAFAGTFHVDETYSGMRKSYRQASNLEIPERPPFEVYCHTLTDPSILGPELQDRGYHTLTLFGLDMPYRLFETDNETTKARVLTRYMRALNDVLAEPIEECLAVDSDGNPCIEIKSPVDLECDVGLNRGNIFQGNLSWFYAEDPEAAGSWGVETPYDRIYNCGSSAARGGGVSGIPGHNAARCIFDEANT